MRLSRWSHLSRVSFTICFLHNRFSAAADPVRNAEATGSIPVPSTNFFQPASSRSAYILPIDGMSTKGAAIALMMMLLATPSEGEGQAPLSSLDQLTLRQGLPAGCSLASDKRDIGFSWPAFIESNPWLGTDRSTIASIREVMYGAPRVVDAPLSAAEFSRFFVRLSDGVNEGYVAVYRQREVDVATVYALTFLSNTPLPVRENMSRVGLRRPLWFERGKTAIALDGDGGSCSRAIQLHLQSIALREQ